ncbi:MAG TPA: histidine kinase [Cytophagales bacterium]|jgi:signal transduction histidine kinase|nr:histidine kinase [Cytophagales bacterium]
MELVRLADWFINPSYFNDSATLRKARLLVRSSLLTSLFSISYVWLSIFFHYNKGLYFTAFNVIGYFVLPVLVRTNLSLRLLTNIYPTLGAITVLVLTWFSGGMWSAIYPWIIAIPVLALLVAGKTPAIYWSIFSFACMVGYGILEINHFPFPVEYDVELRPVWFLFIVPGLLLIIMVVSITFESTLQRAMLDVESQKKTIESQSNELSKLLEEKDQIIRILAHDLKNPLNNITMLSKLLEKENPTHESMEIVHMIGKASNNANVLVKHVLEMATLDYRYENVKLLPIEFPSVLQDVVQSFKNASEKKGIAIHTDEFNEYCVVLANLTYLRLVLENLISNALKFSPPGKPIKVSIALTENVQVRVRDYGPGISVDEEGLLFKKFSRLSARPTANEDSSGLGLSLVKRYMELMNGRVWFERPEDGGAVFAIELAKA